MGNFNSAPDRAFTLCLQLHKSIWQTSSANFHSESKIKQPPVIDASGNPTNATLSYFNIEQSVCHCDGNAKIDHRYFCIYLHVSNPTIFVRTCLLVLRSLTTVYFILSVDCSFIKKTSMRNYTSLLRNLEIEVLKYNYSSNEIFLGLTIFLLYQFCSDLQYFFYQPRNPIVIIFVPSTLNQLFEGASLRGLISFHLFGVEGSSDLS